MIRQAYADAAAFFVETVAHIDREAWSQPALGEWTVRDLVGHTNRAFVTVEAYLDKPAEAAEMTRRRSATRLWWPRVADRREKHLEPIRVRPYRLSHTACWPAWTGKPTMRC